MYIILLFRVRDLLKSGVVKEKPVWYDVMAAFPPFVEPDLSREAEPGRVKKIVYSEDTIRRLVIWCDLHLSLPTPNPPSPPVIPPCHLPLSPPCHPPIGLILILKIDIK